MKNFEGYLKRKFGDSYILLAGGGHKELSSFAFRNTWNDFIHNSNEFTFASPQYSGEIFLNYRTASGSTDGAITQYSMCDGAGGYAKIKSSGFVLNGGDNTSVLLAGGSTKALSEFKIGDYLPLSGGILTNANFGSLLTIKRDSSGRDAVIKYLGPSDVYGYIGVRSDLTPVFYSGTLTSGNGYLIYHSGNSNKNNVSWTTSLLTAYGMVNIYNSANDTTYRLTLDSDGDIGHLYNYKDSDNTFGTLALNYGGGNVTIGTTSNTNGYKLHINGTLNASSTITLNGTAVSLEGHTHNYLPLTGGILTSTSANPLTLDNNKTSTYILFKSNSVGKGDIGYWPKGPGNVGMMYMQVYGGSGPTLAISVDGNAYVSDNKIFHEGNKPTFALVTNKITNTDEFDFVDAERANIYLNYKRADNTVATTPTTHFHFCKGDGNGSTVNYAFIKANGFVKDGSSSNHVLTGDGGHVAISTLYGYIGTTAVQTTSVAQAMTGITSIDGILNFNTSRGALHFEFIGTDLDYGVVKIRHTDGDGGGGPGSYTAALAVLDERTAALTSISGYEPTLYINRSGSATVDLFGVRTASLGRIFTINSSGLTTSYAGFKKGSLDNTSVLLAGGGDSALNNFIGNLNYDTTNNILLYKTVGATSWTNLVTLSDIYVKKAGDTMTGRFIISGSGNSLSNNTWLFKVIQGSDIGSGLYDTAIISSSDVCSLRIGEADGTELGLCGGDLHCTFTSTHDFRFYTGVAKSATIYSGGGGTLRLGLNYSGYSAYVNGSLYSSTGGDFNGRLLISNIGSGYVYGKKGSNNVFCLGSGSSAATLGTENGILLLYHNGTESIRIYTTSDSWITNNLGIGTTAPSAKLHVNGTTKLEGNSTIGSRSWYYQRSGRGEIHHEFTGYDDDYGVVKIRHIHSDGSGGPGSYSATLGIHDERIDNISGAYEPTLFVNRSGATRVPDLIGCNVGGSRVFTVNSSGSLTAIGDTTFGTSDSRHTCKILKAYNMSDVALRVNHGYEKAFTTYDDFILSSNDVATLRICESDGTELGLCGGDGHSTITSSKDLRFYTACSTSGTIYSGASGTWGLTISGGYCTSTGYIKSGSSDSYVLLGGGGHAFRNNLGLSTTASSVTSLDVTYSLISVTIGSGSSFTLGTSAAMSAGLCLTAIVYNNTGSTISITVPGNFLSGTTVVSLDGSLLNCPSGKYLEISILCHLANKYVVSSKGQ